MGTNSDNRNRRSIWISSLFSGLVGSLLVVIVTLIINFQPVDISSDRFEEGRAVGFKEGTVLDMKKVTIQVLILG